MDFKVSQKEERMQPGVGLVDVYVPDVFDLYITEETVPITGPKVEESKGLRFAGDASKLPEYPDNAAGTTYFQDAWVSAGGWAAGGAGTIVTFTSDSVRLTRAVSTGILDSSKPSVSTWSSKTWRTRVFCSVPMTVKLATNPGGTYTVLKEQVCPAGYSIIDATTPASITTAWIQTSTNLQVGEYLEIDWIYIGDGTYSSRLLDASGNGNHGTVFGATPTADGRLSFDGVNDYVSLDIQKNNFTGAFAFSTFLQGKTRTALQYAFWRDTAAAGGRGIRIGVNASNRPYFLLSSNGTDFVELTAGAGNEITTDSHLVYIYIPSTGIYIYRNGLLIASNTTSIPAASYWSSAQLCSLSKFGTNPLDGTIRDPRIYNRALTAAEIQWMYEHPGEFDYDTYTSVTGSDILEGVDELQQAALFASVKQKGSDPLNSEDGVQWAELMLGEISTGAIIVQVKSAVRDVSVNCDVAFTAESDESGNTFLSYQLQVVA
jgi:hypothetical protein